MSCMRQSSPACPRRLIDCSPRDVANLAHGAACAGVGSPEFFETVAASAEARMRQFLPGEVARVLDAIVRAGVAHSALLFHNAGLPPRRKVRCA